MRWLLLLALLAFAAAAEEAVIMKMAEAYLVEFFADAEVAASFTEEEKGSLVQLIAELMQPLATV